MRPGSLGNQKSIKTRKPANSKRHVNMKQQGKLGADREGKINNEANNKRYGFIFQNAPL